MALRMHCRLVALLLALSAAPLTLGGPPAPSPSRDVDVCGEILELLATCSALQSGYPGSACCHLLPTLRDAGCLCPTCGTSYFSGVDVEGQELLASLEPTVERCSTGSDGAPTPRTAPGPSTSPAPRSPTRGRSMAEVGELPSEGAEVAEGSTKKALGSRPSADVASLLHWAAAADVQGIVPALRARLGAGSQEGETRPFAEVAVKELFEADARSRRRAPASATIVGTMGRIDASIKAELEAVLLGRDTAAAGALRARTGLTTAEGRAEPALAAAEPRGKASMPEAVWERLAADRPRDDLFSTKPAPTGSGRRAGDQGGPLARLALDARAGRELDPALPSAREPRAGRREGAERRVLGRGDFAAAHLDEEGLREPPRRPHGAARALVSDALVGQVRSHDSTPIAATGSAPRADEEATPRLRDGERVALEAEPGSTPTLPTSPAAPLSREPAPLRIRLADPGLSSASGVETAEFLVKMRRPARVLLSDSLEGALGRRALGAGYVN